MKSIDKEYTVVQNEKEFISELLNDLQIFENSIQARRVRNDINLLMLLAKKQERKRIRDDVEAKQFETELPDDDGFMKVVRVGDIDIWMD